MTLKQLQAEWHKRADGYGVDGAFLIHQCEEDLAPFILQQERDLELIKVLHEELRYFGSQHWCMKEARSRLKEME